MRDFEGDLLVQLQSKYPGINVNAIAASIDDSARNPNAVLVAAVRSAAYIRDASLAQERIDPATVKAIVIHEVRRLAASKVNRPSKHSDQCTCEVCFAPWHSAATQGHHRLPSLDPGSSHRVE